MSEKGIDYLRKKLDARKLRVDMRYKQYAMKHNEQMVGITIPPDIRNRYRSVIGWCAKGVDSLADRLVFREFENDDFEVNDIFKVNNPDVFFDSVVLSALIASCSFDRRHVCRSHDSVTAAGPSHRRLRHACIWRDQRPKRETNRWCFRQGSRLNKLRKDGAAYG